MHSPHRIYIDALRYSDQLINNLVKNCVQYSWIDWGNKRTYSSLNTNCNRKTTVLMGISTDLLWKYSLLIVERNAIRNYKLHIYIAYVNVNRLLLFQTASNVHTTYSSTWWKWWLINVTSCFIWLSKALMIVSQFSLLQASVQADQRINSKKN